MFVVGVHIPKTGQLNTLLSISVIIFLGCIYFLLLLHKCIVRFLFIDLLLNVNISCNVNFVIYLPLHDRFPVVIHQINDYFLNR